MEKRAVITFYGDLGQTPTEAYRPIQKTPWKSSIDCALVLEWYKRLAEVEEFGELVDECPPPRPGGDGVDYRRRDNVVIHIPTVLLIYQKDCQTCR